jgi:protease I
MSQQILIIVGDGGESYETWFAKHRFEEAGYVPRVAAPSKKRLNLVIHDFEPGWDTYMERPGYAMESDLTFDEVVPADYIAVLCIGGRAPEYLRNNAKVLQILREFDRLGKWLFAICHGVQLVSAAGLVKGRSLTCYEHVRIDAEAAGAVWRRVDAVRDGRLVTAPTWVQHPAFYREVFGCLNGEAIASPEQAAANA